MNIAKFNNPWLGDKVAAYNAQLMSLRGKLQELKYEGGFTDDNKKAVRDCLSFFSKNSIDQQKYEQEYQQQVTEYVVHPVDPLDVHLIDLLNLVEIPEWLTNDDDDYKLRLEFYREISSQVMNMIDKPPFVGGGASDMQKQIDNLKNGHILCQQYALVEKYSEYTEEDIKKIISTEQFNVFLDNKNTLNKNLLHLAIQNNHIEIAKILIAKGININEEDKSGYNSLVYALRNGNKEIVQLLIDSSVNMDQTLNKICFYTRAASTNMMKFLIEQINNPTKKQDMINNLDKRGNNSLINACHQPDNKAKIEFLIANGANINQQNKDGLNALMLASINGNTKTVELLIKKGINIFAVNNHNKTALGIADNQQIKKILEENGAKLLDTITKTSIGKSDIKYVRKVIKNNPHLLKYKDNNGDNLLHIAARYGHIDIVELLLKKDKDLLKYRNTGNRTPLDIVFSWKNGPARNQIKNRYQDIYRLMNEAMESTKGSWVERVIEKVIRGTKVDDGKEGP